MALNEPNAKKYYVSYIVQPGKPWGHAGLLLSSTQTTRVGPRTESTLYDFAGSYPGAKATTGIYENFDPENQKISQYKTWELNETQFHQLKNSVEKEVHDQIDKPLTFNPITQNCKTFALRHLQEIGIPSEDLKALKNSFIPIPVFSGKLNKLSEIKSICETLGKLDALTDTKLSSINKKLTNMQPTLLESQKLELEAQKTALELYKNQLNTSRTTFEKINTSLPVEAEQAIKKEFTILESATQTCLASLERTKFIEPGFMHELKILLEKFKEYFKPTLEGQMKNLSHPK